MKERAWAREKYYGGSICVGVFLGRHQGHFLRMEMNQNLASIINADVFGLARVSQSDWRSLIIPMFSQNN